MSAKGTVEYLASLAGIKINGTNPWDIQVLSGQFYERALQYGSLGLGESYMEGMWDCERLDQCIDRLLSARLRSKLMNPRFSFQHPEAMLQYPSLIRQYMIASIFSRQSKERALQVAAAHYNLGNDLYRAMLDRRLVYSCGYWHDVSSLDAAQELKLELACRKLRLEQGNRVWDIGCGFGSWMKYAAEHYGIECVGDTISQPQINLGKELCAGLPVEIRFRDYREALDSGEKYDRCVSIGMFEHVGYKNYRTFMEIVHRCLRDGGLFLLQTIGADRPMKSAEPWTEKYIFPNGMAPTISQIEQAAEGLLVIEDRHEFGPYYDPTLMAWDRNFVRNWDQLNARYEHLVNGQFYRMWRYYLQSYAAAFRRGHLRLWQVLLSKNRVPVGYEPVR